MANLFDALFLLLLIAAPFQALFLTPVVDRMLAPAVRRGRWTTLVYGWLLLVGAGIVALEGWRAGVHPHPPQEPHRADAWGPAWLVLTLFNCLLVFALNLSALAVALVLRRRRARAS